MTGLHYRWDVRYKVSKLLDPAGLTLEEITDHGLEVVQEGTETSPYEVISYALDKLHVEAPYGIQVDIRIIAVSIDPGKGVEQ